MSPRRSRLLICLDILEAISKGTHKPTRIMYSTNLSWKPMMKILESSINQGLIIKDESENHTTYKLTEKGKNVLSYYNEAMKLIEIV